MKALEVEVTVLKRETLTKNEAVKVAEEKDDIISEVSSRATEAEKVARLATERLLSFASILDQIAGSSRADLLAIVDLEVSLGLQLY